jgi:DNA-binding beta-propeller fold protein YncE
MRTYIVTALFCGFLLSCGVAAAQEAPALTPKNSIPLANVNGRIDHYSVDVSGQRLFVCANANRTVEVIDLKAGKQAHTIPNVAQPQGCYFDASTNRLFVASRGDGTVKIFDGTTFDLLQTATFSSDADNLRYDPRSKQVIVGYGGEKSVRDQVSRVGATDGALAFIDSTGKKIREIPIDAHPESFQLEKAGTRIFVNVTDRKEIEVADEVKGTVIAHWPVTVCSSNLPMSLDEPHHRLFIGCQIPSMLAVIDTETGKVVASYPTVDRTDDLFYDASQSRIYVLGLGFNDVFQQKDPDHYDRVGRYLTPGTAQTGLFVPDLGELFKAVTGAGGQGLAIQVFDTK